MAYLLKKVAGIRRSMTDPRLCNKCAPGQKPSGYVCSICNRNVKEEHALAHVKAEEYLITLIKKDHPEWKESGGSCPQCLDYYRKLVRETDV
ncbi:MAG: hypothetical protein ACM3L6_06410 [Deltaproteobacteria bacterium]